MFTFWVLFVAMVTISYSIGAGLFKLGVAWIFLIALLLTAIIFNILLSKNPRDMYYKNRVEEFDKKLESNKSSFSRDQENIKQLISQKNKKLKNIKR